jgi:hypothetical protein
MSNLHLANIGKYGVFNSRGAAIVNDAQIPKNDALDMPTIAMPIEGFTREMPDFMALPLVR